MSAKKTKTKTEDATKEETETVATHGCPCMPSGELPSCCGPEMKEIMSRFIARFQEAEGTTA